MDKSGYLEGLPALPSLIDMWLSDVVSSTGQPELYSRARAYTLELLEAMNEDGSNSFEQYAPTVAGYIDCYGRVSDQRTIAAGGGGGAAACAGDGEVVT